MTVEPKKAYDELIRRSRDLATLASCSAVLGWDEQTYMPAGGAAHRGNQMAMLAGLQHERATDPRIGELLASASRVRHSRQDRTPRRRRTSASYAGAMSGGRGCRGPWSKSWQGRPRWRSRSGSRRGPRATSGGSAPGWRRSSSSSGRNPASPVRPGARPMGSSGLRESPYDPLLDDYEPGARSADWPSCSTPSGAS